MKIKFIFIILLFNVYKLSAQDKISGEIKFIDHHIENCLTTKYHPNSDSLKQYCQIGCVFVKFNISPKRTVTNVSFSDGSPIFITQALTKAIDSLHLDRPLMEALFKLNKTVMVPFLYYYQDGCNYPAAEWTSDQSKVLSTTRAYLKIYMNLDHTSANVYDMLKFKNQNLNALDCLLIAPIRVSSGKIY